MSHRSSLPLVLFSMLMSSLGFGQVRIISHIASEAGGFSPGLIIANLDPGNDHRVTLHPYTIAGELLPLVETSVPEGQTQYKDIPELFGRVDISHILIDGDLNISVSTTYQATVENSTPVHVPETRTQAPSWRIFPGNWDVIWDGIALVNPNSEPSQIQIHQKSALGHVLHSQESVILAPFAKYQTVLSDHFEPIEKSHFEIVATQPLAITALRGSTDGRFLWANTPIAQPEISAVFAEPTFMVSRTLDVKYGEGLTHTAWNAQTSTKMDLLLDTYEPMDTEGLRPAIIFIHGGGFSGGSKSAAIATEIMTYFAERGFVGFSIDYRLIRHRGTIPKPYYDYLAGMNLPARTLDQTYAMYPAGRDAKAAVRWVRAQAEIYQIDTNRIVVAGGSAGAVTAIALGASNNDDFKHELSLTEDPTLETTHLEQDDSVDVVIDYWGSGVMINLLAEAYANASPWDASDKPMIMIHGTLDPIVPFSNALELESYYQQTGVPYELYPLEGEGHSAWNATVDGQSILKLAFDFVAEKLQMAVIP